MLLKQSGIGIRIDILFSGIEEKSIETHTQTHTHTDKYMAGCFSPKCVKVIQEKDSQYWNNRLSVWNKINLVPYHTSYRKLIRAKI